MVYTTKSQLSHSKTSTPAPIANIAGGGEYLLSAFNQFKRFLALSLLITFSFNAFSVDNSQQPNKEEFNKEAYLDLSKPYKQNNPQSATKKDNQATTLLKAVAGSTRAALGSTNSDNTDQLGNKVTTSIKNQAINKTEGLLNNSVNEFLNAFGAGRSEVSIGGISTKKLNYSLRTIQPLSELNANSKELTFIQAGIASGNGGNGRRATINLGIGHRLLVEDDMAIAGINFFTDYETKSSHKRLSLGLEYQRANFSANINKYHMFSDKKLVNSVKERGMSGYDVKLSGQAPYLPWAKIKGTYYYWDAKTGPNIRGNILGVAIELTPSVSFEFGQENNNTMDAKSYGKLTVKLPLGNKQKFTNFAIANKAFKDSRKMDLGALAWVERSNKIMIERGEGGISFKGLTYKLIASPNTGRVWLDRNLGATKVADSSTDIPAYGDYFPFSSNNDICPADFSVPTEGELAAETTLLPDKTKVKNIATAFSSFLKLPAAGYRKSDGTTPSSSLDGVAVLLWTKTKSADGTKGRNFSVSSNTNASFKDLDRTLQLPVRCIQTQATISFKSQLYKEITSRYTGRVWLDRNLGAKQVAVSSNDTGAYGDLYQWGRGKDGHEDREKTSISTTLASSITPASGEFIKSTVTPFDWVGANVDSDGSERARAWKDGGANDICPVGFNVPTNLELNNEINKAGISNRSEAFSSFLKIPTAGYRNRSNGGVITTDSAVFLWTRDPFVDSGTKAQQAKYFSIDSSSINFNNLDRAYGFSIRCIKTKFSVSTANDPVVNDPSDPSTEDTINFNGFKYKTVLSPNTGKIWLDRNLGAKRAATSSTDTDAYGAYYQFGAAKCPVGFGVPTEAELKAETTEATAGIKVINFDSALKNFLQIPAAGFLNNIGNNLAGVGEQVAMWTKDESVGIEGGRALGVKNDWVNRKKVLIAEFNNSRIHVGLSVRCVKD